MAKKIDFKTFLTKIVNIFPKDMYLVHNWCAIAGEDSDLMNRGFYLCILDSDIRELLNNTFPNNPILYIKSIRDLKTDLSKIEEVLDDDIVKKINTNVESYMSKYNKIDNWDTFNFTDDEISTIFTDGKSFTLFENDDSKSSIIISKSIFPLISEKNINDVRYNYSKYNDGEDLNQITIVYDYELFQLVMQYLYLNI